MSTEGSLRLKLKKKAKVVVRVSRNSVRNRGDENSFDSERVYDRENGLKQRGKFRGTESGEEGRALRTRKNENSFDKERVYDRENGLRQRGKFRGMESGEEGRAFRTRKNENSFDKERVYDRENGFKQRGKFKGTESGEGRALRTRKNESSFDKNRVYDRENGLKKRVTFKGMGSNGEGMGREFGENRGKLRTLNSSGRNKRIYAKEERFENGKLRNDGGESKKTLFENLENQVKHELLEEKTDDHRTMWGPGVSWSGGKKTKHSTDKVKDKKENSSIIKKQDQDKPGLAKKDRDQAKLGGDAEILDDRPKKKKKKVIRIEYPNDISKKRVDDVLDINGSKEENKREPEKEPVMSKNAEFRAIQPSPSILSFVENNLLGKRRLIDLRRAGYNIDLSAPLDNIPFSKSAERERIEENAFKNKLEFFAAAKVSSSFPPPNLPEIAFAGRSNVGKSSLLNALTRQWGVARTSDKPGLTQTINFFNLGAKLCLVDLPGYGFAYAKDEVKENWEELVKEYVSTRVGLRQVCLLVDTKWGMKPRDHELIDLMERSRTKYQVVLTKTDVVFPIDVARRAMQIEESLLGNQSIVQPLMMVSSKSGAGIRSLRTVLANIARFVKI
ncbi:PREDICTED: uncharacterized protein LOC109340818 isoform X2 [Lupinus angustifolius]|uniref:uncharacterized protein LOC109340818 isoform X2 n=1 Tax=Lupinus angustifolius TaxID=3871 RepID=UPI00092ECAE4|nr:PREDICTED: uncharacterized protein LOC109340818 isoform X2 [Lupinus angustifolius]